MSQLDAEDLLLRKPLPGYAVYTFDGEAEHGELAFSKGQRIHIFCEDFGEGWSIGMLVDANGLECATAAQKLSRGLLPKGFVQYDIERCPLAETTEHETSIRSSATQDEEQSGDLTGPSSPNAELNATRGSIANNTDLERGKDLACDNDAGSDSFESLAQSQSSDSLTNHSSERELSVQEEGSPIVAPASTGRQSLTLHTRTTRPALVRRNSIAAYIEEGAPTRDESRQSYVVEDGQWKSLVPRFHIAIPSYSSQDDHIVFRLVSSIRTAAPALKSADVEDHGPDHKEITVERRYTHFADLDTVLRIMFPLVSLPHLPPRTAWRRITDEDFLGSRRRDLERYIRRAACHPLIRSERIFLEFLGNDDSIAMSRLLSSSIPPPASLAVAGFLAQVEARSDFFDLEDLLGEAKDLHTSFASHANAVESGHGYESIQSELTDARMHLQNTGRSFRSVSHSIYKLVSGLAQPVSENISDVQRMRDDARHLRLQNAEGAFCWLEGCDECLSTTKAAQGTAIALAQIADLYEVNATEVLLPTQEGIVELLSPATRFAPLLHRLGHAIAQVEAALLPDCDLDNRDAQKNRGEAVLCALQAELAEVHRGHQSSVQYTCKSLLDSQIAFHKQALDQLQRAQELWEEPTFIELAQEGPRMAPLLEQAVFAGPVAARPLPLPSAWGKPPAASLASALLPAHIQTAMIGAVRNFRSAATALQAQSHTKGTELETSQRGDALAVRFAQFLSWQTNARGENRRHA